eukprot:5360420-Prymnesium_polylepis.1
MDSCSGSGLSSNVDTISISPHSTNRRCSSSGLRPHIRSESGRGQGSRSPFVLPILQRLPRHTREEARDRRDLGGARGPRRSRVIPRLSVVRHVVRLVHSQK